MTMSDLSREAEVQRADELLASLSKVTLAGCAVLALAFSVLTGAGAAVEIFGVSISTRYAPQVLSFLALVVVFEQCRHVRAIDFLVANTGDRSALVARIRIHPALLNPYFELGREDRLANYLGVTLLALANVVMMFVVERMAFGGRVGGRLVLSADNVLLFGLVLAMALCVVIFVARVLKRSLDVISGATAVDKIGLVYLVAFGGFVINRVWPA